jgi:hypothetical protein
MVGKYIIYRGSYYVSQNSFSGGVILKSSRGIRWKEDERGCNYPEYKENGIYELNQNYLILETKDEFDKCLHLLGICKKY